MSPKNQSMPISIDDQLRNIIRSEMQPKLDEQTHMIISALMDMLKPTTPTPEPPPPPPEFEEPELDLSAWLFGRRGNFYVENNIWGFTGQPAASWQAVGAEGAGENAVDFHFDWRVSHIPGGNEVVGFPYVGDGQRAGYGSYKNDRTGELIEGRSANTILPKRIADISTLTSRTDFRMTPPESSVGHATLNVWATVSDQLTYGWANGGITTELIIPMFNRGGYANERHAANLVAKIDVDGCVWFVYRYKRSGQNHVEPIAFPNGYVMPANEWALLAFVPSNWQTVPAVIDIKAIIEALITRGLWREQDYISFIENGWESVDGKGPLSGRWTLQAI